jgi:parallel beta-helix repeat protein
MSSSPRPVDGWRSAMKIIRSLLSMTAAAGIAVLAAQPALAATTTLYVDNTNPACSNSGPGSLTTPYCTIGAAAAVAVAGQTVEVVGGTYRESVSVPRSGTPTAQLVFTAHPGVTITGGKNGFKLSGRSYVTVTGFTITVTTDAGIQATNSTQLTITANDVSRAGIPVSDSIARGITLSGTTNSVVSGNVTHHNTDAGIGITSSSTGNVVSYNESYANARQYTRAAAGIDVRSSPNNLINANRLHDNEDSGLNIWSGSTGTVGVNNVAWRNGDHGIDVHSNNDAVVVANTVYANYDSGIEMTGSLNTRLANNVTVDNGINSARTSGQIRADTNSAPSTVLDYDLLYLSVPTSKTTVFLDWGGVKYTSLSAFQAATGREPHGIQANPSFVDATVDDLHLRSDSPAIDTGDNAAVGEPSTDADGVARPVNVVVDRGAYEFH